MLTALTYVDSGGMRARRAGGFVCGASRQFYSYIDADALSHSTIGRSVLRLRFETGSAFCMGFAKTTY